MRDEKLQSSGNREAAKNQYYHQTNSINTNILQVKKHYLLIKQNDRQAKFCYSSLEKAFEKQTKTIDDQGQKQMKAIEEHIRQLYETNVIDKKNDSDSFDLEKRNI